MTLASIPLMDRTGRRTLHLYGLGGMFIFSIFITISFLIKASTLYPKIYRMLINRTNATTLSDHISTLLSTITLFQSNSKEWNGWELGRKRMILSSGSIVQFREIFMKSTRIFLSDIFRWFSISKRQKASIIVQMKVLNFIHM